MPSREPRVKVCGLTNLNDAELAVELGAWALGMIFYPGSPRRCSLEEARRIATKLRRRVELCGVFVNAPLAQVAATSEELGLSMLDVDDYATELHNPEITEPQGSGNVPERNYKTLAALAARRGDIGREAIPQFMTERGMPGFAPTQGHLASALCYLPHAVRRLTSGDANRVHMIAKGSLFLGRMTQASDGMSVLLERNQGFIGP